MYLLLDMDHLFPDVGVQDSMVGSVVDWAPDNPAIDGNAAGVRPSGLAEGDGDAGRHGQKRLQAEPRSGTALPGRPWIEDMKFQILAIHGVAIDEVIVVLRADHEDAVVIDLVSDDIGRQAIDEVAAGRFVIVPLGLLSGTFYSVDRLAPAFRAFSHANPFFYIISGFRYGFLGTADSPVLIGSVVVFGLDIVLALACYWLLNKGWKIKS